MSKQGTDQRTSQERKPIEPQRRDDVQVQAKSKHARRTAIIGLMAVSLVVIIGLVSVVRASTHAPARSMYPVIDHIPCQSNEQSAVHFHVHMSIYIAGKRIPVPAQIGIAPNDSCQYWLHTHDESGIIHIETPKGMVPTLGAFLDIWHQQFRQLGYPGHLSDPTGWQVFVNGKFFPGEMQTIVLRSHLLITLAYHSPGVKPDTTYEWNDL